MKLPRAPQRATPGFAFSIVQRALLEAIAVRRFGKPEMNEVVAFFGEDPPRCVFCGDSDVRRWDHLVPVAKGGDTTLGNMVPACGKCDDSKGALPFEEWALSRVPNSPHTRGVCDLDERLKRIREYVAKYAYQPQTPEQRLGADELRQFEALRQRACELQGDFDAFIQNHARGRERGQ